MPFEEYVESLRNQSLPAIGSEAFGWSEEPCFLCKFTEAQVRGFQLLDVLLHELGHHHDRMTTRSQRGAERGEAYAEAYAVQYESLIWDQYLRKFPL